ncbi:RNA polymerase sigma factor [Holdemania sp. Marseille-P2844]|uniref:RNA polymerase sigma factor n=1 Tax=Holdemania sp. Marseille-P2844 TaxID=1852366 RepID=UPI0009FA8469|nr:sigma-70 family RNA polymerase sigma factor [Holdemania sp. Marseille-P2844]
MDAIHPKNNIDPRPKRRRDKDNPYEIFTVGIETDAPRYYIRFKDGFRVEHCLEIPKELFDLLDSFELDDLSFLNEWDRHLEQSEQTEATLMARATQRRESVEEEVFRHIEIEMLHKAIATLPEVQQRRVLLYYFGNLTYQEIADLDGCSKVAVKYTIDKALASLKKIIE